jgi:hypothetical protein
MGAGHVGEMKWRRANAPTGLQMLSSGGFNVHAVDSMQQFWRLDLNSIENCQWKKFDGAGTYIDGTEGKQLWCTNASDDVFYYYYGWTSNRWEKVPDPTKLVMVSVGKGQYVWGINREGEIFKTNETTKKWVKMPGKAMNLSTGRDGSCWCVNANCEVYRWVSNDFLGYDGHWEQMPGSLRQISVYNNTTVIGTNTNDDIWYWDQSITNWKQFAGSLRHVSVGWANYEHVWGINSLGEVWYHRSQRLEDHLYKLKHPQQHVHTTSIGIGSGSLFENWKIGPEGEHLVFRDSHSTGDHRIAVAPRCGNHKAIGSPNHPDSLSSTLADFGIWSITEENSALCIRDTRSGGDHRIAFYPGCGNGTNYGSAHNTGHRPGGDHVYYRGRRWVIREESGVLVFRDTLTPGDHRIALYPNCGNSLWL